MKKRKKLTYRQKAVNRISRRLNTLKKRGIALKIPTDQQSIINILGGNGIKVTKKNINEVVNKTVENAQLITRQEAKRIKQELKTSEEFKFRKISEIQELKGQELANLISGLYDTDEMELYYAVKEAYGY